MTINLSERIQNADPGPGFFCRVGPGQSKTESTSLLDNMIRNSVMYDLLYIHF